MRIFYSSLGDYINNIFSNMIVTQYVSSIALISVGLVKFTTDGIHDYQSIINFLYILALVMEIFCYCYFGQRISTKVSLQILKDVYIIYVWYLRIFLEMTRFFLYFLIKKEKNINVFLMQLNIVYCIFCLTQTICFLL